MKNKFKTLTIIFTLLTCAIFTGCENKKANIYYLNYKSEVENEWNEIFEEYSKTVNVNAKVETGSSALYDIELKNKLVSKDAPTIFQVDSEFEVDRFEYCYDLRDTKLYEELTDKSLAIEYEGKIVAIPYCIEGYGLITNKTILEKYFSLEGIQTKIKSIDDINSYEDLKIVCEDLEKFKDELGIDGVFASTSFAQGEDWRWSTHLFNYALYYEYLDRNINDTDDLKLSYFDYVKNALDLYLDYSNADRNKLGDITVEDSLNEFAQGKCVFVQNGNWAWDQIDANENKLITDDDVTMLPIFTGCGDESNLGICIGTQSYFAINKNASQEDIDASIDFLVWLNETERGNDLVINKLKFISPFSTFKELPSNPLAKNVIQYYESDKNNVTWNFITIPSENFKTFIGRNLYNYVIGTDSWESIKNKIIESWNNAKTSDQIIE